MLSTRGNLSEISHRTSIFIHNMPISLTNDKGTMPKMTLSAQIIKPSGRAAVSEAAKEASSSPGKLAFPVFLYLLGIAIPIEFKIGPLNMSGVRTVLIVFTVPILIKLLQGRYGKLLFTDFLFFLFSIWVIITLFKNTPASALSFGGSVAVEFFGGYLLARAYVRSAESMLATYRAVLILLIFTIPLALYEGQTGQALIPNLIRSLKFSSFPDFTHPTDAMRLGLYRPQVIFAHPIHYGLFGSTVFSIIFVGFEQVFSKTRRYMSSALIFIAVFLSLSSGGLLPVFIQMFMIFWAFSFRRYGGKWYILLSLMFMMYLLVSMISNRTALDVFMSYATFNPGNAYWRKLIFIWGMQNVWANPFMGIGLNDWFRPEFMTPDSVDNFWLLNAMRYGIPGFLLITTGFLLPVWRIAWHRIEEANPAWKLRRAWVFTILALTFALSTVDVWSTALSYVAFLFGSGIWFLSINAPGRLPIKELAAPSGESEQLRTSKLARPVSRFTRFDQDKTRGHLEKLP